MDPNVTPSFEYLSKVLGMRHQLQQRQVGTLQWNGHHLLALVRYAIKIRSNKNHGRFIDRLRILEESAYHLYKDKSSKRYLRQIGTFLKEIVDFFAVPKLQQCWTDGSLVASFVDFLVEALEVLSVRPGAGIIVHCQINLLLKNLKFLLAILGDTPFQCTDLEETKNILAEIECIANEAGIFLFSFFFTKKLVQEKEMDQALSFLLPKFGILEAEIKEHCTRFSDVPSPKTPTVSVFIVDSVIDDLNHLIIKNKSDHLSVDLKDQIMRLHKELSFCRSSVRDREEEKNKALVECALQLRDLAHEAQYIITWFMSGEIPVWYLAIRLSNFISMCEQIKTSLQEEIKLNDITSLELEVADSHNDVSSQIVKSFPVDSEIIVGFEEKIEEITSQLVGESKDPLKFISIVGMPGIGKTTLAKKLYSHSSVVLHFDKRAWCVVSQTYRKKKLLIDIFSSISEWKVTEIEDGALGERIYKSLKGRRYLIVMDDMWNKDVWDDLRRYFPDDRNGSRIVFTSRDKNVAFSDGFLNELSLLSVDQCWELLQKMVFKNDLCPQELHDVGRKIAKNCKGLPLAVVGIAAILANMRKKETLEKKEIVWQEVATSLVSYISEGQDILELSYKHLPIHLKPCFLYLGVFDEDVEIQVKKLLPLWISQGFIQKKATKTLEDIAEEYLTELINRSLVQVAKRRCDGGVKTCKIHDLIHAMGLEVAKKEHFLNVPKNEFSVYEQHRHLCIHSDSHHFKSRPFGLHVHSLLGNFSDCFAITSSQKLLKALQLSNTDRIEFDGVRLDFLNHLKFLELQELIPELSNHKNVEFLFVSACRDDLPLNMPKLRHLHIGSPKRFGQKWDISQTNSIETLSGILIVNSKEEKLLRGFPHLRRLRCVYHLMWAGFPDLRFLRKLESLNMFSGTTEPRKFMRINFPAKIRKLSLHWFHFTCEMMSAIGKLPKLEILKLDTIQVDGENWTTNDDEFLQLKILKLENMYIKQWFTSRNHFPALERLLLKMSNSPEVPSEIGYIPTLQMIEVYRCATLVKKSVMQINEEQVEEGNEELKVIISSTNTA